jgi:hypothetical protein
VAVAVGHNSAQMEAGKRWRSSGRVGKKTTRGRSLVSSGHAVSLYVHGCFCVLAPAGSFGLALSGSVSHGLSISTRIEICLA